MDALTKVVFTVAPGDVIDAEVVPAELNGVPIPGCPPEGAPKVAVIGLGGGKRACIGVENADQAVDIFDRYSGRGSR
jgi:hypothetical protein